jgi:hypothetical protein
MGRGGVRPTNETQRTERASDFSEREERVQLLLRVRACGAPGRVGGIGRRRAYPILDDLAGGVAVDAPAPCSRCCAGAGLP